MAKPGVHVKLNRLLVIVLLAVLLEVALLIRWTAERGEGTTPAESGDGSPYAAASDAGSAPPAGVGYPEADPSLDLHPGISAEMADSGGALVALVIDDLGYQWDSEAVQGLLALDADLTVAVIPGAWASKRVAREAAEQGKEVMLHVPMEPDHLDPNVEHDMLHRGMSPAEVEAFLDRAADQYPQARGLNNHMGSSATQDTGLMAEVARQCARHNWWMLDSITHPGSVLYAEAVRAGVPAARRDIFLDHRDDPGEIRQALYRTVNIARRTGRPAIAVGHPRTATWAVLAEEIPRLTDEGVQWIPMSRALQYP